jgi:hypothetical protein
MSTPRNRRKMERDSIEDEIEWETTRIMARRKIIKKKRKKPKN